MRVLVGHNIYWYVWGALEPKETDAPPFSRGIDVLGDQWIMDADGVWRQITVNGILAVRLVASDVPFGGGGGGGLTDTELRATPVDVAVTNLPAVQPVSATALPLPAGAATEATLASVVFELQQMATALEPQPVSGPLTNAELRATAVPVAVAPTTAIAHNVTTIAIINTPTQLQSSACTSVSVKALPENVGNIYLGGASVTSANGMPLAPGESGSFDVSNANLFYITGEFVGDGVAWISIN